MWFKRREHDFIIIFYSTSHKSFTTFDLIYTVAVKSTPTYFTGIQVVAGKLLVRGRNLEWDQAHIGGPSAAVSPTSWF